MHPRGGVGEHRDRLLEGFAERTELAAGDEQLPAMGHQDRGVLAVPPQLHRPCDSRAPSSTRPDEIARPARSTARFQRQAAAGSARGDAPARRSPARRIRRRRTRGVRAPATPGRQRRCPGRAPFRVPIASLRTAIRSRRSPGPIERKCLAKNAVARATGSPTRRAIASASSASARDRSGRAAYISARPNPRTTRARSAPSPFPSARTRPPTAGLGRVDHADGDARVLVSERRTGERLGVPEARRIVRRLLERGARLPGVARPSAALPSASSSATRRGRSGGSSQQLGRALEVPDRLLVAELRRRLVTGAFRILERRGGVAERGGAEEVMRQLAVGTIEAAGAQLLQGAPDAPMQLAAVRGRQVLVEGLADERVREPALSERGQAFVDKTGRDGGAELLEDAIALQLTRDLEEPDVELPSDTPRIE